MAAPADHKLWVEMNDFFLFRVDGAARQHPWLNRLTKVSSLALLVLGVLGIAGVVGNLALGFALAGTAALGFGADLFMGKLSERKWRLWPYGICALAIVTIGLLAGVASYTGGPLLALSANKIGIAAVSITASMALIYGIVRSSSYIAKAVITDVHEVIEDRRKQFAEDLDSATGKIEATVGRRE